MFLDALVLEIEKEMGGVGVKRRRRKKKKEKKKKKEEEEGEVRGVLMIFLS